ncbi:50S ribosomal protein L21e [Candidatus Nanosalina sp. VS9-1]|uniref:50S ribosomal protein L21e n=1 Tax=Candidatus Nanosalina sp. VS9-1 TaxID=3388566 RepID=UPI0039E1ECD5
MAQKSQGSQQGARKTLKRDRRQTTTVNDKLKEFEEGEKALVKVDSSVQESRPHMRFHGRTGEVVGKRGQSYEVEIKDGGKTKTLFLHPAHLQEIEG